MKLVFKCVTPHIVHRIEVDVLSVTKLPRYPTIDSYVTDSKVPSLNYVDVEVYR